MDGIATSTYSCSEANADSRTNASTALCSGSMGSAEVGVETEGFERTGGQIMLTIVAVPLTLLIRQKRALRGGKANIGNLEKQYIPSDLLQILSQAR